MVFSTFDQKEFDSVTACDHTLEALRDWYQPIHLEVNPELSN